MRLSSKVHSGFNNTYAKLFIYPLLHSWEQEMGLPGTCNGSYLGRFVLRNAMCVN